MAEASEENPPVSPEVSDSECPVPIARQDPFGNLPPLPSEIRPRRALAPSEIAPQGSPIHSSDSVVAEEDLGWIREYFGIPEEYEIIVPQPGDRPYSPPIRCLTFYLDSFLSGLRLPLNYYIVRCLGKWSMVPAQLVPNAWRYLTTLIAEASLGAIPPSERLIRALYRLNQNREPGWYYFSARRPAKIKGLPSSTKYWKNLFVFIRSGGGWPLLSSWVKPTFGESPDLSDEDRGKAMELADILGRVDLGLDVNVGQLAQAGLIRRPVLGEPFADA